MNATKKTITTLTAAAALALGGIAVAQTTGSTASDAGASTGSSSTLDNSAGSTSAPSTDASSSTMGAAPSTDTSTSSDTTLSPQVDRN